MTPSPIAAAERNVELIACAALRHTSGLILCAPRHGGGSIHEIIERLGLAYDDFEQGFVTNKFDRFVTREEAHVIAKANGQIRYRCGGDDDTLYSENLY